MHSRFAPAWMTRSATLVLITCPLLIAAACGDDDSPGTENSDAAASDATTTTDASSNDANGNATDGAGNADGNVPDATNDGAADASDAAVDGSADADDDVTPPHFVFVTAEAFNGDLVAAANALPADAGLGKVDGGPFTAQDWQAAGDALCQNAAITAHLPGAYWALLDGPGVTHAFARVKDADGPWALPNGLPVAANADDLGDGFFYASIDVTENGVARTHVLGNKAGSSNLVHVGMNGVDCNGWTSSDGGSSYSGSYRMAHHYFTASWSTASCALPRPLYCLAHGTGGGPLQFPAIPANGKRVFVTKSSSYSTGLAAQLAADGGAADAGVDAVHAAADAICNAEAAGKLPGVYRAWVSSSTSNAKTYFASRSMNGPWHRPSGLKVADNLATLSDTNLGVLAHVLESADGTIVGARSVMTATNGDGTLSADNCLDFTSTNLGDGYMAGGRNSFKDTLWASGFTQGCGGQGALYCFEQ